MTDTFDPENSPNVDKTGLFICKVCNVVEEIPHYIPEEADNDPRIGYLVTAHLNRHPSFSDRLTTEWASLGFVPTRHFKDKQYRQGILDKVLEGNGLTGFDAEFYDTQNTFKADALECYSRHNRPSYTAVKCQDYNSYNKEIKPDTKAYRKEAGIPSYDDTKVKKMYICSYCPYEQSIRSALQK